MIKERGGKEAQISSSGYSTRYSPRWAAIALTRNTFIKSSTRDWMKSNTEVHLHSSLLIGEIQVGHDKKDLILNHIG
jgi:hypothetical protein